MKVNYESITETLDRVIAIADKQGRVIDSIELNRCEWDEFSNHFQPGPLVGLMQYTYNGIAIKRQR